MKTHFSKFQWIHRIGTNRHGDLALDALDGLKSEKEGDENNANEIPPLPKQRFMTHSPSTNTTIINSNKLPILSTEHHRINSRNSTKSVSITVDLPTIRPSAGIYSSILNKQPSSRISTTLLEDEGGEEENEK